MLKFIVVHVYFFTNLVVFRIEVSLETIITHFLNWFPSTRFVIKSNAETKKWSTLEGGNVKSSKESVKLSGQQGI